MATRNDLVGNVYGRLTVLDNTGRQNKWGNYFWKCSCICGNNVEVVGGNLTQGTTKSCGCLQQEQQRLGSVTHGKTKTAEHYSWQDILKRCAGKTEKYVRDYVERGISVHEDFKTSFQAFYDEIGPRPSTPGVWSVGRIDNNGDYTYGNLRWELPEQQSRNRTKRVDNKTGVTGVSFGNGKFVAQCKLLNGKSKTKSFSVSKYGHDDALALAIAAREEMITELNTQGAGYSDTHGQDK